MNLPKIQSTVYHLDSDAVYRQEWDTTHISIVNDAVLQIVSVFAIGFNKHFNAETGADASVTNSNSNFGQFAIASDGFRKTHLQKITKDISRNNYTKSESQLRQILIGKD